MIYLKKTFQGTTLIYIVSKPSPYIIKELRPAAAAAKEMRGSKTGKRRMVGRKNIPSRDHNSILMVVNDFCGLLLE